MAETTSTRPLPRYVPNDGYNIQHDPDATDKVLSLLMEGWRDHPGEPVYLTRLLGTGDVWTIHRMVEYWRHLGHLIDGERGTPGYTYRGCRRPKPWTHVSFITALRQIVRDDGCTS